MKKVFVILAISMLPVVAFAQTQSGKVRTAGTSANKGEPIEGVAIKMSGDYNSVLSDAKGAFEVRMVGLRNGDPIAVERVFKPGYVLLDDNYLGTEKSFSTKVPLEIVMKSKSQIERERRKIEETAYANANVRYESRIRQLDSALKASLISAEDRQKELEKLQEQYQAYESLIESLSKHYSMMDYDTMSDIDAEINRCIILGHLHRADSLLNSKGNMSHRINDYQEESHLIAKAENELEVAKRRLQVKKQALLQQKQGLATDLYNKYTISISNFELDSAEYYILARASLDTANVSWQLDAGHFLENYSGKYQQAYEIYVKALKIAEQNNYNPDAIGSLYNAIGILMNSLGHYTEAMQMLQIAKKAYELNPDQKHPNKAAVRNNIAGVYGSMMQADSMLVYAQEALKINQAYFGDNSRECAFNLNMIGNAYEMRGEKQKALEMYNKVIDIYRMSDGEQSLYVALSYNNIASVYKSMGNLDMAIATDKKAWEILMKITDVGSIHRITVSSNLAVYSFAAGDLNGALEWIERAIAELEYGKSNMTLLQKCYKEKGRYLIAHGRYNEALVSYDKGLSCANNPLIEMEITIDKASLLENFGFLPEALDCYKALLNKYESDASTDVKLAAETRVDLDGYINQLYIKILQSNAYDTEQTSRIRDEYNRFLEDKIYLFVVTSPDGAASKAGLSGTNYLIRLNEWEIDSLVDFYQYSSTLSGKEKNVVLFTPEGVKALTFENKIGARMYMDRIPKEWKVQIMSEYRNWLHSK